MVVGCWRWPGAGKAVGERAHVSRETCALVRGSRCPILVSCFTRLFGLRRVAGVS